MNETTLYSRITSQWPSFALRLHMPHAKGVPDFHLTTPNGVSIYAEVKLILGVGAFKSTISQAQAQWLRQRRMQGVPALVIFGYERGGWHLQPIVRGLASMSKVSDLHSGIGVPTIQDWVTVERIAKIWDNDLGSGL